MNISSETRSDILDYLLLNERPFHGNLDLISFLKRIWDLSSMRSTDRRYPTAEGDIRTHIISFPDWSYSDLLYDHLDILGCSDEVFNKFVGMCLHPLVISDEQQINEMLAVFNLALARDGYQLEVEGRRGGKPTYKVVKRELIRLEMEQEDEQVPLLDQATYQQILQVIHDTGKAFERLPATYYNKGEEDLRDHFLLQLVPRFSMRGSVTGETFNKLGKTDILIQHANSIVFIAECKIWNGKVHYLETITQLLTNITWRDSKAAVIIFVNNKEISSVLETVKRETAQHSNYLSFMSEQDISWFNYRFHINDDPIREVKLAIMLYHIPPVYTGRMKQNRVYGISPKLETGVERF